MPKRKNTHQLSLESLHGEFDAQVRCLIEKKYPKLLGMKEDTFIRLVNPLRRALEGLKLPETNYVAGLLSFVIVIQSDKISSEKRMALVQRDNKKGYSKLFPHTSKYFDCIPSQKIPKGTAYLLFDIDRGKDTIKIAPDMALTMIKKKRRHPLTIDEGIAIITLHPEYLMKNNCFSLLASRGEDKRVPAIWINAKKQPNLGWCWAGNPHTWLGSATCGGRLGLQ